VVSLLLSVTFACGLVIAVAHVLNRQFVAPVYDVAANLLAFGCAVAASVLLAHWTSGALRDCDHLLVGAGAPHVPRERQRTGPSALTRGVGRSRRVSLRVSSSR
jgi:hypothetical protein